MDVLRWGRSAYETDEGLALEANRIRTLGGRWSHEPDATTLPPDGVDVLVVNSGVKVTAEVLRKLQCRLVLTTTSGYDHIDLTACRKAKVIAARCPMARRDAVVEHSLAAMIWLRRQLSSLHLAAVQGRWARSELPILRPNGLSGATVAVIGLGVIGHKMVEILRSLGANVLGVDPTTTLADCPSVPLDEAVERADILTLHCALNESNRGQFDAGLISRMRQGAILVNTARGPLLDVEAAAKSVRSGHLGGLSVDVFPVEPYPSLSALTHPNILLTPHASGYTDDLAERVSH